MLVTHLRAKVELRNHPNLKETTAAVIVDRSKDRPLVVDSLPAAPGVTAGMTLEQALSRNTDTTVLEVDEPSYRRVFHRMLTALQGISDRVEGPELGTAYVRLDGLEGMYGGNKHHGSSSMTGSERTLRRWKLPLGLKSITPR